MRFLEGLPALLAAAALLSAQRLTAQSPEARAAQIELSAAVAAVDTDAEDEPLPDGGRAPAGHLRIALRASRWLAIEMQLQGVAGRRSDFVPSLRLLIQPTRGRLAPFVSLGMGSDKRPPTTDATVGISSVHLEAGHGLRFGLTPRLALRAEYLLSSGSWEDPDGGSDFWGPDKVPTDRLWSARALSLGVSVFVR